jgi:hypothetical protein
MFGICLQVNDDVLRALESCEHRVAGVLLQARALPDPTDGPADPAAGPAVGNGNGEPALSHPSVSDTGGSQFIDEDEDDDEFAELTLRTKTRGNRRKPKISTATRLIVPPAPSAVPAVTAEAQDSPDLLSFPAATATPTPDPALQAASEESQDLLSFQPAAAPQPVAAAAAAAAALQPPSGGEGAQPNSEGSLDLLSEATAVPATPPQAPLQPQAPALAPPPSPAPAPAPAPALGDSSQDLLSFN